MAKIKTNSTAAEQVAVNITPRAFFRFALMVVATLVLIISVRKASHALLLVFTAFVLTLALNAPIYWVSKHIPGKRRGSRSIATTLSFLIVIIILGGIISLVVPRLVHQTESLVNAAPHLVQDFRSQNGTVGKFVRKYHLQKQLTSFSSQLSDRLHNIGGTAFSTAQKIGSSAFSLVTILALTFMMLIEGPGWLKFMRQTVPNGHRDMADRLSQDMYRVIRGYVNGQVLLAAIATALIIPAVLILHIGYPLALIAVIFVCGLIPMVGHTIGAVIVTLVALFHSLDSAIIILIYYILYQQVENYLIQPKIQANSTNMSPLLVFMSVVIGVSFGGLFGGLIAIPAAGCLRIVILEYLRAQNIISEPDMKEQISKHKQQSKLLKN